MSRHGVRFGLPFALAGGAMLLIVLTLSLSGVRAADASRPEVDIHAASASALPFTITLAPLVTSGLNEPVHLTHAGDGSGRLFVVEKAGYIRVITNGILLGTPYLDIHTLVQSSGGEQGLLSVAFEPDFETNGTFYVNYTGLSGPVGDTVIARYVVADPSANVASVVSFTNILTIPQPEANHNGGQLQFGPNDNYLYIGMGDGGSGGDPHGTIGNGQDLSALLGKLLRINVRGVPTYTVPPTNPFTQMPGARPEVWAYGLRNPWRFSFDRATGDLYLGDVGQNCFEEIDYQPASSSGGENYGWRVMEGLHAFDRFNPSNCNQPLISPVTLTLPITEYVQPVGNAVIGGYVYRGSVYPHMQGVYFYGDAGSGRIWALKQVSPGHWEGEQKLDTSLYISSFGEDEAGELYVVSLYNGVYKVASGNPIIPPDLAGSTKQASVGSVQTGEVVTYSIVLTNLGGPVTGTLRVTDTLPGGLEYIPGSFQATSGITDISLPVLTWQSAPSPTFPITLTCAVTVSAASTLAISNVVLIDLGVGLPVERSATIVVNPYKVYLPMVLRP